MADLSFFTASASLALADIAALAKAELVDPARAGERISGVAGLVEAGPRDLIFFDNVKYGDQLPGTRAGACLVTERLQGSLPPHVAVLRCRDPYRAFVAVARQLFPSSLRPQAGFDSEGIAPGAIVHASARLEAGVSVDPGAVIGPGAEIGAGTRIGSGAVIGPKVRIGRDCSIGQGASVICTLIGNRVTVHPGCRIGQDGFGYLMGANGHLKVPQIGRVIIQDDVEIGANTCIDRGAIRDTVIGEGTKIDNLVQIGHNVVIGRHCVIVAFSGLSGSSTLEDGVVLGARVGLNNHITIGEGAQIAATSNVHGDVPAGARWGGSPAKPIKQWFREVVVLERLGKETQRENGAKAGRKEKDEG
ncbi:MAG: UDP-3-O-(3-hydroxymyristoyl)glucosamine N-acyltransferase [Xanthobacteraceae bacterium]|nr:MAG: UDP-3-O-(3-hydroxymyristoyl)glucosamine N-acyltransferase [Xanthobacteraceae bacterium]